jgi:hypothetical protein
VLHQVTLDGWANESCGDVDQDGFHASLVIVEPAEQSELPNTFDHPIPAGNWVLTQGRPGSMPPGGWPHSPAFTAAKPSASDGPTST